MSVSLQACPSCGRALSFGHEHTNLKVCTCGSVLYRSDDGTVVEKAVLGVQQGFEVITPGAGGSWNGEPFTVLGRVRAWIEEFVWNYWTIAFESGRIGYLGEGYGLYALYEPAEPGPNAAIKTNGSRAGDEVELFPKQYFLLERKYTCYKWEAEGEAWLPFLPDTFETMEFAATDGRRMELLRFRNDIRFFNVHYTSFSDLKLTGLKAYANEGKKVSCRQCHSQVYVKTWPFAQSFACPACDSRYGASEGTIRKLNKRNQTDTGPGLQIGATGILNGVPYEVIGYALKSESKAAEAQWKEYTLFHPTEGYAFLSEFEGHYILARESGNAPVLNSGAATEMIYADEPYQLFNRYRYTLVNAKGEFPYNLFNDGDKDIREFISPPEMWIQEKCTREGIVWFHATHIGRKELQAAFGEAISLPDKIGVGVLEPKGYISPSKLMVLAVGTALLLLFLQLLTGATRQQRVIYDEVLPFPQGSSTLQAVVPQFHLEKYKSNLRISVSSPLDNNWVELGATLVNVRTGAEYSAEQGVEYYSGYDGGEYWSEGDRSEDVFLTGIPEGDYVLQLQGLRPFGTTTFYSGTTPAEMRVLVLYDMPMWSNLLVCLIPALLWLGGWYLRVQHNENRRWANSPFSPEE